ncbi:MAG: zinc-binding dehydrogenase [Acidimicrobiia bacterium]|nr:zinc-binding dehydrogenase [Acidimicrobiia bacterium]NNC43919.1 zinc-binding dehydrogenase [Acidimicrobiia bacterium]
MSIPEALFGLIVTNEGHDFSDFSMDFDSMEPYLRPAGMAIPELQSGQVLIKVRMAAINPSDRVYLKGAYGQPRVKGIAGGFEGVGDVIAVGSGLYGKALDGRRVSFVTAPGGSGSWADYAITDAKFCIPLRDEVKDEDAAGLIVNPVTAAAMHAIAKKTKSSSFVLTAGASQLSKFMIALGRDSGMRPIAIVRRDEQIGPLMGLGAAHVLNLTDKDFDDRLAKVIKAEEPRTFFDAVVDDVSTRIHDTMPSRSRWVIYGKLSTDVPKLSDPGQMIFRGKQIEGFWLTEWIRSTPLPMQINTYRAVQARFADGRWSTSIAEVIPLDEAMERLPSALAKATGKVLLKP